MKTEKKIFYAFILNLFFSIFEFIGGAFTGSVAIISDAVHDMGDALSIGISFFLEKKSKREPDDVYTYGYQRFSVIGSLITTVVLLSGSVAVIYNAISRIIHPVIINYNGMIIFAIIGLLVNLFAALITKGGNSLNQKAVNLHMLEDVLGWLVVLIGAIIMRFTNLSILDPIMSIGVAVFIFINATKNLIRIEDLFTGKIPSNIKLRKIKRHVCDVDGVLDAHHIHIWSMDGNSNYATMHVVTDSEASIIKEKVREALKEFNIVHVTIELENSNEHCHYQ